MRFRLGCRATLASVAAVTAAMSIAGPAVGLSGSGFQGADGDLVSTATTKDWDDFIGRVAIGQDTRSGQGDDSLGAGSKDDSPTPTVTSGAIPSNKSDLERFYVASENVSGKDYLYLGWTRNNTLGTANMSIELNKLRQPDPPASGPWALRRSAGDLLFLFDFDQGGKSSAVKLSVSKWVTSGSPKTVCQANNALPCWGKKAALSTTVAEGEVNRAAITDPLDGGKELAALTFGEAAINLTDAKLVVNSCVGFGSATLRSRASSAFNAELKDFIAPIDVAVQRSPDPNGANARGSALGATVKLGSADAVSLPTPPGTDPSVSTTQTNAGGPQTADASQADVNVDGLSASVIRTTSTSSVSAQDGANQTSTAEAVGVNIMDGLVKANLVRAVATTTADDRSSGFSSAGSVIEGLEIDGVKQNVAPGTRIGLSPLQYGDGSYVAIQELGPGTDPSVPGAGVGTTDWPAVGQAGKFKADLTVTMIRVHVTDDNGKLLLGGNVVDITVSKAVAHSEFNGIRCTNNDVSGHAFIARAATTPQLADPLVGYVGIPRSGGEQTQTLNSARLGSGGLLLTADTLMSHSVGVLTDKTSYAESSAVAQYACLLKDALGACTIEASVLKAASRSAADASSRSSDPADTAVVAAVRGVPVPLPPGATSLPPNTRVEIPGIGFVTFNEQFCDGGASLLAGCASGSHTGLTVRAIHLVVNVPDNALGLKAGAEFIVNEAHSDAGFVA